MGNGGTRPVIGVNGDVTIDAKVRSFVYVDYLDWIVAAGGIPVLLPPVESSLALLDRVDAVLLTGGDDYRASLVPDSEPPRDFVAVSDRRESFDFALCREVIDRDLPVLGVCGGFQLLALAESGSIVGDIPSDCPDALQHRRHSSDEPLTRHPTEWLRSVPGLDVAPGIHDTNSHHHQSVDRLPDSWSLLARTTDGIVEAGVGPGRFQVGVQWHPEKEPEDPLSRALAQGLVDTCRRQVRSGS